MDSEGKPEGRGMKGAGVEVEADERDVEERVEVGNKGIMQSSRLFSGVEFQYSSFCLDFVKGIVAYSARRFRL